MIRNSFNIRGDFRFFRREIAITIRVKSQRDFLGLFYKSMLWLTFFEWNLELNVFNDCLMQENLHLMLLFNSFLVSNHLDFSFWSKTRRRQVENLGRKFTTTETNRPFSHGLSHGFLSDANQIWW